MVSQGRKIILVMDNLNTHKPASLYEVFEPKEARRLLERLEIHYTPKHGSWLDMAETELGVSEQPMPGSPNPLTKQPSAAKLPHGKNPATKHAVNINWRFTTKDARIKLKRLYPSFQVS